MFEPLTVERETKLRRWFETGIPFNRFIGLKVETACFAMLDRDDDRVSTVDLRVDYLRPGPATDLYCAAEVIRLGNRVGVARAQLYASGPPHDGAEPIAIGQAVYNILRRPQGTT